MDTLSSVESRLRALEAFDGFLDEFERLCDEIRKDMFKLFHQLKAENRIDDPIYAQLEQRFLKSALATKKRIQAQLKAMDRSALLHRRLQPSPSAQLQDGRSGDTQLESMASEATQTMHRLKATLTQQNDSSLLSHQVLERSGKRMQGSKKRLEEFGGVLGRTKKAMTGLWRRERDGQIRIMGAFGVFLAAALYIVSKRIWMPPFWILFSSTYQIISRNVKQLTQTSAAPASMETSSTFTGDLFTTPSFASETADVFTEPPLQSTVDSQLEFLEISTVTEEIAAIMTAVKTETVQHEVVTAPSVHKEESLEAGQNNVQLAIENDGNIPKEVISEPSSVEEAAPRVKPSVEDDINVAEAEPELHSAVHAQHSSPHEQEFSAPEPQNLDITDVHAEVNHPAHSSEDSSVVLGDGTATSEAIDEVRNQEPIPSPEMVGGAVASPSQEQVRPLELADEVSELNQVPINQGVENSADNANQETVSFTPPGVESKVATREASSESTPPGVSNEVHVSAAEIEVNSEMNARIVNNEPSSPEVGSQDSGNNETTPLEANVEITPRIKDGEFDSPDAHPEVEKESSTLEASIELTPPEVENDIPPPEVNEPEENHRFEETQSTPFSAETSSPSSEVFEESEYSDGDQYENSQEPLADTSGLSFPNPQDINASIPPSSQDPVVHEHEEL